MGFNQTRKPTTMYSNVKPLPATQAHTAYMGNAAGSPRQTIPPYVASAPRNGLATKQPAVAKLPTSSTPTIQQIVPQQFTTPAPGLATVTNPNPILSQVTAPTPIQQPTIGDQYAQSSVTQPVSGPVAPTDLPPGATFDPTTGMIVLGGATGSPMMSSGAGLSMGPSLGMSF